MLLKILAICFCITAFAAAAEDQDLTFGDQLREDMQSVPVDEFVNGFIVHCLANANRTEKLEQLVELLVKNDFAFEVDAEFAEAWVGRHVMDQRVWVVLSGLGTPAFIGLYDARIFGSSAQACSFGNTRLNSEGLIDVLNGKIPELELLKEGSNGARYEAVFRYNRVTGTPNYLVRIAKPQVASIGGAVIEVYWPDDR